MAYIYDIADTWNASGTTFNGIKLNVTDTASAAGSLLMDLQKGGVSQFSVNKNGVLGGSGYYLQTGALSNFQAKFAGATDGALGAANGAAWAVGGALGFTTANNATGVSDLKLERDAANTLAQRNGVNAQAFNLYNTYTDASNYERGFMRFVSNTLRIGTEKLGTGTARALEFYTDGTVRLTISTTGTVTAANDIYATSIVASSSLFFGASSQLTNGRVRYSSPADGQLYLRNNAENDFSRIMLGGTTSSFPSIKRSTTSLQARLADDSAFTNIQGKLTTDTAYTAGAPTATGYIVLFDGNGTAYKVPAVAL